MKTNTLFLLGVSLLFSHLISSSVSLNCTLFAGKDGTDLASGAIPSSNGFRYGASLNLVAGAQIAPHYVSNGIDYFLFSSPTENVIKKLTFFGEVETWVGNGTAGYVEGRGTNAVFNSPKGISAYNGAFFVADYNNMKVRKISAQDITSLFHDFSGVMYPLAVYAGSKGVIILGDNHSGTGQSVAIASITGDSTTPLTKNSASVFSTGQCNSVTQDGKSTFNTYFGCGTTIKKYDSNLNHISDYSTTFNRIGNLFMNSNTAYPAPLYVTDSGANVVYSFNTVSNTKTLVAGMSGVYNRSKDIYSVTSNCSAISFNTILSVAASNATTLVMLTKTNIYVQVPSSTLSYPNVYFPSGTYALQANPLPNLLTLDFNSYNASTLSTTLNFHPEYLFLTGLMDVDFTFADFIISWWGVNSTNNVTLIGDQISTLNYDFTNFKSSESYFIKVQYRTPAGISSDTTYEFGPQTKLISGPQTVSNFGYLSYDGVGSNAQYNLIDHITFDPVKNLFYFADEYECYIRFISLSNGTEQMVAGNGCYEKLVDGNRTIAYFEFPLNAVFDPVHRLLYIQDGGNDVGALSTCIRTIDVDNHYYVKTLSISGFSTTIYTFTVDGSGNLYIYGGDKKWYYVTKSGSTFTVTANHTDTTFTAYGTSEAYWTQGDICANSGAGVSTCLVVQATVSLDSVSASYGPVYTVTIDTFVATELNLGNYIFDNIGVDQTGHMFVYSATMGLGKYLLDQKTIAWFGGDSLSIEVYLFAFDYGIGLNPTFDLTSHYVESYDYQIAAFAQYDQGHGTNTYSESLYPITFDSNGNVYLLDTYNFRQYTFSPQVQVINNKITPYCYNLTISVSKALQGTPQYFTFQDFGCNTTDWNIISVNTTTLYSYQDPNQVKLSIQPSMSGLRPVHYQIISSDNQFIHTVITQITIVNQKPVASDVTFTWNFPRNTQTFPNWNLLINCTDHDGDSLSVVQILKMDTRTASSVVQLNNTMLYFVPEKVVLSVLPTGEISLFAPSTSSPVTAGSPLALSWNEDFRFQFQITDDDVTNQYAWGVANINSI